MKFKFLLSFVLVSLIGFTNVAKAEADPMMAQIPCEAYLLGDENARKSVISYVDGYLTAVSEITTTNEAWLDALLKHADTFCTANKAGNFAQVVDGLPDYAADENMDMDMATLPCSALIAMDPVSMNQVGMWINGFAVGYTQIDPQTGKYATFGNDLGVYCGTNPDAPALGFVDTIKQ